MSKDNSKIFVLEDYESEFSYKKNKSNLNITFNRIAFIYFVFFMIFIIYTFKVFYLGSLNSKIKIEKFLPIKKNYRADILDNNGDFIAKAINTQTAGINPSLIIDEKKLLIRLQLLFPDENFKNVKERIKKKNTFVLKKNLLTIKLKNFVFWETSL